jgi:MscS family membrane protein
MLFEEHPQSFHAHATKQAKMFEEIILSYLPPPFDNIYVVAGIIFIGFLILSKLFVYIAEKVILALTRKTKTNLDDMIVERTEHPISWLLIFIGLKIALEYLNLQNGFADFLSTASTSLIYISVGVVVVSVVVTLIDHWGKVFSRKTKSKMDDALVPLFRTTVKVIMVCLIGVMVLDLWGVNITGLLAGLGIAGLALGFAVKDSLANVFGGISLILDKTFNVGDKVELEDGTIGVVKDVGIRATRIRTYDNEAIIVPNGTLANMRIKNFHLPDVSARVSVAFGVEYGADPDKVKKIVLAEIKKMKDVMKDPEPFVKFDEMADSALNMKAFFWVDNLDKFYPKKEEATTRIYKLLNKHRIGIPFPQMDVHLKKK